MASDPGPNVVKLFTPVIYRVPVPSRLYQPSLMFVGKAKGRLLSSAPLLGRLLALPSNIKIS
jgi:hypothetical protein